MKLIDKCERTQKREVRDNELLNYKSRKDLTKKTFLLASL